MLEAAKDIELGTLPRHVAIIMDGNGRWAEKRKLPRVMGHRQGAEAVRRVVKASYEIGIAYLTLYAFSSENWKRPVDEVDDLMALLRLYLKRDVADLNKNNVNLHVIGERDGLPNDIRELIYEAENLTGDNDGMTLTIALNYGAQAEIVRATRAIAIKHKDGVLDIDDIDEEVIGDNLYTRDLPDPDLLIRTSGEQRLSNFLLWQAAYAELLFVDQLWPDFDRENLIDALQEYTRRERRFGARNS